MSVSMYLYIHMHLNIYLNMNIGWNTYLLLGSSGFVAAKMSILFTQAHKMYWCNYLFICFISLVSVKRQASVSILLWHADLFKHLVYIGTFE